MAQLTFTIRAEIAIKETESLYILSTLMFYMYIWHMYSVYCTYIRQCTEQYVACTTL